MSLEHYDRKYKGYRIYFGGYTAGMCVDNPAGIRIANQLTIGEAKNVIKTNIQQNKEILGDR